MKQLYIDDSSDEETISYDFSQIWAEQVSALLKPSYIFTEIGQSLLESVRPIYKNEKFKLREQLNLDSRLINVSNNILSDYLKYKKLFADKTLERSIIDKATTCDLISLLNHNKHLQNIRYEKQFYDDVTLPIIKEKIFPKLTNALIDFIFNNTLVNESIWNTLDISPINDPNKLLLEVFKVQGNCMKNLFDNTTII